jgi:integrase
MFVVSSEPATPNGHLQIIGDRGNRRWRAFWWDADGKHSRILGRAWAKSSGKRTPRGAIIWHAADGPKPDLSCLTPNEAHAELRRLLEHDAALRPTPRSTAGVPLTFADAATAWLEHGRTRRNLKRSTLADYTQAISTYLLPAAGDEPSPRITRYGRAPFAETPLLKLRENQIKAWHDTLPHARTAEKLLMIVRAVLAHARRRGWIESDPTITIERQQVRYSGDYDFYSPQDVQALVAAAASAQDAAIYLTAAVTGLRRGELVALRWRDIDFAGHSIRVRANYSHGQLVTPKSGKIRTVPMVPQLAETLADLAGRKQFTEPDDPVFIGNRGGHLDASALRRRYAVAANRAGLRPLPFHSLRHHFGSTAVNHVSLVQVQTWMGHSHIQTTARYLHAKSQASDAALLAAAFGGNEPDGVSR